MEDQTRIELEAAAFRGMIAHLQKRTDVQNIDVMNLQLFLWIVESVGINKIFFFLIFEQVIMPNW